MTMRSRLNKLEDQNNAGRPDPNGCHCSDRPLSSVIRPNADGSPVNVPDTCETCGGEIEVIRITPKPKNL